LKEVTETADVEVTSFRLAFGLQIPDAKKDFLSFQPSASFNATMASGGGPGCSRICFSMIDTTCNFIAF